MIYQGQRIIVEQKKGIAYLTFNNTQADINKFDKQTLQELEQAISAIAKEKETQGVLVNSSKNDFIVGADINKFLDHFSKPEEQLLEWLLSANRIFNAFEDLPFPTIAVINGNALGGGFEMCLAADYRIMSDTATVGLPEVKLGIFPGFGGTVRLPRLIGADNAIEWICMADTHTASDALKMGVIDATVNDDKLESCALDLLQQCQQKKFNWQDRRQKKKSPLTLGPVESMMVFETAKGFVKGKAGPHYPAPVAAIKTIQAHADLPRDKALEIEARQFIKMAKTPVSNHLVNLFLNDQFIKKKTRKLSKKASPIKHAAVIGAGIMGGGISYQSAYKGIPVTMKDVAQLGLDHGLQEARKLLCKQMERKKIDAARMGVILSNITPTLHYASFGQADITIEAVVENEKVKTTVLKEIEQAVTPDTIICSNTSTLSITQLAQALKHPENFCGMHFFNPVHRMPLVEVIRGEKSSDAAIATTVAYAQSIGKTPIVVNDCPGFFVNRVLFPYFAGFAYLVNEQVDFLHIDKVMESFGWPMGPAYLLDVVGLDTAIHAESIMAKGFPERMKSNIKSPIECLFKKERLGQKNKSGFYTYKEDKKGKPIKEQDLSVHDLLYKGAPTNTLDDEKIIHRMLIPMAMEAIRCLEENIIASPAEADMALIYGLGFPPFRGGIFRFIDEMGLNNLVAAADQLATISPLYAPTDQLRTLAEKKTTFYAHYQ